MEILYQKCCGLDVHKKVIVACLIISEKTGESNPHKEIRSFGTTTKEIKLLRDWLVGVGCTHVAMESTGVYWKPIYNVLEGLLTLIVVNPRHMKAIPGKKTDMRDAEWIADLLRHGLLKGSFIPSREQRELRDLTRYRSKLTQERGREVNRLHKILEDTGIKLGSVVSDLSGKSAHEMLEFIVGGETDPKILAELARGRMRSKRQELETALVGTVRAHHQFMIAQLLAHIDYLDETIQTLDRRIAAAVAPHETQIAMLDEVTGIGRKGAEILVAEIGVDMSHFPTSKHLASWACMCPGNNESAGKSKSGRTRKGNNYLRSALTQMAHAAGNSKGTFLGAQYRRLAARIGEKKAAIAVGHSILGIAYHILSTGEKFVDLGADYLAEDDPGRLERRLVKRLEKMGYEVSLRPQQKAG